MVRQRNRRIHSGSDSLDPLMHHHPTDLGFTCLVKKRQRGFRILSDLRIQFFIMSYHDMYMAF